jgi:hypothetical protein
MVLVARQAGGELLDRHGVCCFIRPGLSRETIDMLDMLEECVD